MTSRPTKCYDLIHDNLPEFDASGYLGGTWKVDSIKWLAGAMIGSRRSVRMIGPKTMGSRRLAITGSRALSGLSQRIENGTQDLPDVVLR